MMPYCKNNSNFTFREIYCSPPRHEHCDRERCKPCHNDFSCPCSPNAPCFDDFDFCENTCCDWLQHNTNKDCNIKQSHTNYPERKKRQHCNCHKCHPNQFPEIPPYVCLPINNNCNPFTYVMIGYMFGKKD